MGSSKTPFVKIGQIEKNRLIINDNNIKIIDQKIDVLQDIWKNAIWNFMG